MSLSLPEHARCRGCGYLLRGLMAPLCPECGRTFDPVDESTYALGPRRPLRRFVAWVGVLMAIGGLGFAFAPRGIYRGKMTFTCAQCSERRVFERWELQPPRWVAARYPAVSFGNTTSAPAAASSVPDGGSAGRTAPAEKSGAAAAPTIATPPASAATSSPASPAPRNCSHRRRNFSVDFGNRIVVRCSGTATPRPGGWAVVNGMKTTPDSAEQVLAALMAPTNNGIRIGTAGGGWTVFDFLNAWNWVNKRVEWLFSVRRPPSAVD